MFTSYCQSCGSRNQHPTIKPKFCQNCGHSFHISTTPASAHSNKALSREQLKSSSSQVVEPEEDDVELEGRESSGSWANMGQLQFPVEIEVSPPKKEKLGTIAGTSKDSIRPIPEVSVPKNHRKKMMELYKSEAGTLRKKKR